jgi:integrase
LTLPARSVSIPTDLNLTPDLINRLTAIRSLLALGDLELVAAASVRLESFRSENALAAVLDALASHRFSEADQMISAILTKGLRMTTWTDPEIVMLEAELAKVTAELADLESEHAELGHLMARFYAEHAAALGDRIAEVLRLRLEMLRRKVAKDPSAAGKTRRPRLISAISRATRTPSAKRPNARIGS